MANHKSTDQPGSKDLQANHKRTRNQEAHDTGKDRPNGERIMQPSNKSKQGPEDDHQATTKSELAEERGGHGHSGHSDSRNGSRK